MIAIASSPKLRDTTPADRVSPVGILGRLPPELVLTLLGMLGARPTAHVVDVCFQSSTLIQWA